MTTDDSIRVIISIAIGILIFTVFRKPHSHKNHKKTDNPAKKIVVTLCIISLALFLLLRLYSMQ